MQNSFAKHLEDAVCQDCHDDVPWLKMQFLAIVSTTFSSYTYIYLQFYKNDRFLSQSH